MNLFESFFDNATTKSVAVSILIGVGGWTAHTLISTSTDSAAIANHTTQLQKLWEGQAQTHKDLQDLTIAVTRVEGKVDTVNQKIDDDRRTARR